MFPESRELISQLKTSDHHFGRLFEQQNTLDQRIKNMESRVETGNHEQIEILKKREATPERPNPHDSSQGHPGSLG
jgi:uncharacterized protein YdcH (DUF465 family)